ncbi:MAG: hypothetical protein PGN37_04725 [Mycobacterium kyogaense]|uniref:hypothetical protein n=1 Tax=Mycobacterium kyogaense TaxID=2212479 RepID=UPI002FFB2198
MEENSRGFGGLNPIGGPAGPEPAAAQPTYGHPAPGYPAPPAVPGQWAPQPYPPGPNYGEAAPPPYWGPGYGPPPIPPRKKPPRGLWIALGAIAVIAVVVVAAIFIFRGGSGGGGADNPSLAVQEYFEALSRGDAKAALALGESQPPDTTFLTDEILKKQIAAEPITDVKTLGETPGAQGAVMVQVSVSLGGKTQNDKIPVSKSDDGWKVPHAAMRMDLGRNSGLYKPQLFDAVTIFGKPAPKSGVAYVFPGPVELGSANPNIEITGRDFGVTPGLMNIYLGLSQQNLDIEVSEDGTKAIRDAILAQLKDCARSTQLQPPNCPFSRPVSGWVDGTAQWTAPPDLSGLSAEFLNPQTGTVNFFGTAEMGLRVQTDRGQPYETTTSEFLTGDADMLTTPPTITYRQ